MPPWPAELAGLKVGGGHPRGHRSDIAKTGSPTAERKSPASHLPTKEGLRRAALAFVIQLGRKETSPQPRTREGLCGRAAVVVVTAREVAAKERTAMRTGHPGEVFIACTRLRSGRGHSPRVTPPPRAGFGVQGSGPRQPCPTLAFLSGQSRVRPLSGSQPQEGKACCPRAQQIVAGPRPAGGVGGLCRVPPRPCRSCRLLARAPFRPVFEDGGCELRVLPRPPGGFMATRSHVQRLSCDTCTHTGFRFILFNTYEKC